MWRITRPAALAAVLLLYGLPLFGRPEFLLRYASDPFSRPELRGSCGTCHVNPEGSGPRNAFGRAFDRNDHRVTPAFRLQWPDHFLQNISAEVPGPQEAPLKATWAAGKDEEFLVEIGGEQYLLNRAEGSVKKVDAAEVQAFRTPPPVPPRAEEPEEVLEPQPTLEYYLVNLPTNRVRPPRSLHLRFSHRFDDPTFKGPDRLGNLFGFDSFSISSFGIEVGLLRRVSFVTYRSPIPRRLSGPTIELGPVFHLLQQGQRVPVSFSFRATVEGEDNFSERFTTNLVPVISRSIGNVAELFVVPTFNLGVPRRTLNSVLPPRGIRTRPDPRGPPRPDPGRTPRSHGLGWPGRQHPDSPSHGADCRVAPSGGRLPQAGLAQHVCLRHSAQHQPARVRAHPFQHPVHHHHPLAHRRAGRSPDWVQPVPKVMVVERS